MTSSRSQIEDRWGRVVGATRIYRDWVKKAIRRVSEEGWSDEHKTEFLDILESLTFEMASYDGVMVTSGYYSAFLDLCVRRTNSPGMSGSLTRRNIS